MSTVEPKNDKNKETMDLFDEYWFFNNPLNSRKSLSPLPKTPPLKNSISSVLLQSPEEDEGDEDVSEILVKETEESLLMGAPSMPSPFRNGIFEGFQDEGIIFHKESSQLKRSMLRQSSNSGSNHSSHSAFEKTPPPNPRFMRQHSSISTRKNYPFNATNYKAFQEKKWKSSSDLESIEVQGFKDLGFVFDKEELKESLATMIPGLREKKGQNEEDKEEDEGKITRPYLSEAWCIQRSLTSPSFKLMEKRSTAEMKDQLRFWARAVASNVLQES